MVDTDKAKVTLLFVEFFFFCAVCSKWNEAVDYKLQRVVFSLLWLQLLSAHTQFTFTTIHYILTAFKSSSIHHVSTKHFHLNLNTYKPLFLCVLIAYYVVTSYDIHSTNNSFRNKQMWISLSCREHNSGSHDTPQAQGHLVTVTDAEYSMFMTNV